jgi:lipopolysaccharide export system permease protein
VGKKDSDGKTIRNVIIYEQGNSLQDNCIVAEKGVMKISEDKNFLEFNLENGYRYQERGTVSDSATEFIRLGFREYKKLFDLSVLQKQNTNDSIFRNNHKMLSARQLTKNIDSLKITDDSLNRQMYTNLRGYLHFTDLPDSVWRKTGKIPPLKKAKDLVPDSSSVIVNERALTLAGDIKNTIQFNGFDSEGREKNIRFHEIEWHRKFSFSLACLVLFFIGAPLGSIIRKGGMGMPLVVAIVFFLIFHLLNMFGEIFVREGFTSPFVGMWLAVLTLIPVGIFLTYKAMHDSQLFSKEFYHRTFKKIYPFLNSFKRRSSSTYKI